MRMSALHQQTPPVLAARPVTHAPGPRCYPIFRVAHPQEQPEPYPALSPTAASAPSIATTLRDALSGVDAGPEQALACPSAPAVTPVTATPMASSSGGACPSTPAATPVTVPPLASPSRPASSSTPPLVAAPTAFHLAKSPALSQTPSGRGGLGRGSHVAIVPAAVGRCDHLARAQRLPRQRRHPPRPRGRLRRPRPARRPAPAPRGPSRRAPPTLPTPLSLIGFPTRASPSAARGGILLGPREPMATSPVRFAPGGDHG